ncbi:MAG: HEPN domain-containing protein [Bryobacteraceae bacterium]|nr:HEPN domain-containing protein [Bryobacteraceae bacterium]
MTPEELRRDEAVRWCTQARKDLNAARLMASPEPPRSVFHSQQAVEKAAEAFLTF